MSVGETGTLKETRISIHEEQLAVIASDVKCKVASKTPKFLLILPTFKGGNYNPGQNVWGTLSIFDVFEMQIKLISPPPPPPPEQCWVFEVKHLLHILHRLRTSALT